MKSNINFSLPVTILKEKKRYVAYTPALDLSTSGKTYDETKKHFEQIVQIFFEEISEMGTLDKVLGDLGWAKIQRKWRSPVVISNETESFPVRI